MTGMDQMLLLWALLLGLALSTWCTALVTLAVVLVRRPRCPCQRAAEASPQPDVGGEELRSAHTERKLTADIPDDELDGWSGGRAARVAAAGGCHR